MAYEHLAAVNLFDVKDRVAVITGGGSGLGFITAATLVVNGAKVYITGRRESALNDAIAELNKIRPGRAVAVQTNVTSRESLNQLVETVSRDHDFVDILFANAGVLRHNAIAARPGQSLEELHAALSSSDPQDWNDTLSTNVTAVYYTVVAFMPLLGKAAKRGQGRGSVVITGSVGGMHWDAYVDTHDYQASKAAVHHLMTTLAVKLIPHGIRVNCIAPGIFPSGMVNMEDTASTLVQRIQTVPAGRAGKDTDLAGLVLLLSSEAGAFIIGRTIPVDGGRLLTAHG